MNNNETGSARRAAAFEEVTEVAEISTADTGARRGAKAFTISRKVVALGVVSALAVGTLFTFALNGRNTDAASSVEGVNANQAIPAAAAEAAELGFADRSEEASRDVVRSGVSEAVGEANNSTRQAALGAASESADQAAATLSAEERDRLMDEDMVLVAKQADKLKQEAEAAQRRLEAAERAKANASTSGDSTYELTDEDIANLTDSGASLPIKNGRRGAYFGKTGSWSRYHTGQDFPAPTGTPIYAAASGVVMSPTSGGWAGINVVIRHANGGSTLYAHMSKKVATTGQTVKAGQLIGYVGTTGRSFGAHLHFEYYKPGVTPGDVYKASDPMAFLNSLGLK